MSIQGIGCTAAQTSHITIPGDIQTKKWRKKIEINELQKQQNIPENRPKRPKRRLISIPTIHFQVRKC